MLLVWRVLGSSTSSREKRGNCLVGQSLWPELSAPTPGSVAGAAVDPPGWPYGAGLGLRRRQKCQGPNLPMDQAGARPKRDGPASPTRPPQALKGSWEAGKKQLVLEELLPQAGSGASTQHGVQLSLMR